MERNKKLEVVTYISIINNLIVGRPERYKYKYVALLQYPKRTFLEMIHNLIHVVLLKFV